MLSCQLPHMCIFVKRLPSFVTLLQKLVAAVQRMALLKSYHAFMAWQALASAQVQETAWQDERAAAAKQHMVRWRVLGLLRAWRERTADCTAARQLLGRLAQERQQQAACSAFYGWRACVAQRAQRMHSMEVLLAAHRTGDALAGCFGAWRCVVEDAHGLQIKGAQVKRMLARRRTHLVFGRWLGACRDLADARRQSDALTEGRRQLSVAQAFAAWATFLTMRHQQQQRLVSLVEASARRIMLGALTFWREHAGIQRRGRLIIARGTERLARSRTAGALAAWCMHTRSVKAERHRVQIFGQRQRAAACHRVLAAWKGMAAAKGREKALVAMCERRRQRAR
jgi:hypothetical protein